MNKALENLNTTNPTDKTITKTAIDNLTKYETTLETVGTTPFAKPDQPLLDALAEKFSNQDVFVDLWATWCSPCIKQFSYNTDLHSFLESKNIKTLYLSVDKEDDSAKWEKYIEDYRLKGYHFLANKAYQEKFINPLGETIPRYFIYNSKKKELKLLEGVPSEKEKFYEGIAKALQIK